MTRLTNICIYTTILTVSLLSLTPLDAHAQSKKRIKIETTDSVPFFNGLSASVDLVGIVQKAVSDYGQYEAALRVNLRDRYFPIVEIGKGIALHDYDPVTGIKYETSALYGKIGLDFNVMRNKHDIYRLYIGGRYAYTSFDYDLVGPDIKDPVWGGEAHWGGSKSPCKYHWAEAVVGVDAKIYGPFHLGWSVRYKARVSHKDGEIGKPWYVPGYGISGTSQLGVTFNAIFEI